MNDKEKYITYWIESSDKNFATMDNLFKSKDYDWSLFIGHLVIEKLLKAYFVKTHEQIPPFIHNLIRLAELSGIDINDENTQFLSMITSFNINSRYDDYKETFYKKCTPEFTEFWINKINDYRIWIKNKLSE